MPGSAPSNWILIGRYVCDPAIFDVLRDTPPGRGGEIQLTDALQQLAKIAGDPGGGVYGVVFRGRRYDTGDRLDYLKAVVRLASERKDLGPPLRAWLRDFVAGLRRGRQRDPNSHRSALGRGSHGPLPFLQGV